MIAALPTVARFSKGVGQGALPIPDCRLTVETKGCGLALDGLSFFDGQRVHARMVRR